MEVESEIEIIIRYLLIFLTWCLKGQRVGLPRKDPRDMIAVIIDLENWHSEYIGLGPIVDYRNLWYEKQSSESAFVWDNFCSDMEMNCYSLWKKKNNCLVSRSNRALMEPLVVVFRIFLPVLRKSKSLILFLRKIGRNLHVCIYELFWRTWSFESSFLPYAIK